MPSYTPEEVKKFVARRTSNDDAPNLALGFEIETKVVHFEIIIAFQFWPQFRTFVAYPMVIESDGIGAIVKVEMPNEWFRYLKRELRKTVGVCHFHNVNVRDNSKRIEKLLGLKCIN
jgi:hypothetical protein